MANFRAIGGGYPMSVCDVLWENSNPSQSFSGQSFNISVNKVYTDFIIDFALVNSASNISYGTIATKIGTTAHFTSTGINYQGKIDGTTRDVTLTQSGDVITVSVGDCNFRVISAWGSLETNTTDNTRAIPLRILGIVATPIS